MPVPPPDRSTTPLDPLEQDKGMIGVGNLAAEEGYLAGEDADLLIRELESEEDLADGAWSAAKRKLGLAFWIAVGFLAVLTPDDNSGVLPSPYEQPRGLNATAEMSLPPLSTRLDGSLAVLGTDSLGRDQLSRIMWGARVSLGVGFASVGLGLLIGGVIGLTAGYFRGPLDSFFMAGMDILLAFPALLLALSIVAIRGKGPTNAIIALTIVSIPTIARLVRANTLVFSQREFVVAARTLGASNGRVMGREVLPNVSVALLPFIPLGIAVSIAAEGALAYLGQSAEIPEASWGAMIAEGRPQLDQGNWWVPMVPIAFLVITLVSLNLIGDRLREYFSIKEVGL